VRIYTLIAVALTFCILCFGCTMSHKSLVEINPPYTDGEAALMEIQRDGQPVGYLLQSARKKGDIWQFTNRTEGDAYVKHIVIKANAENLTPISTEFEQTSLVTSLQYTTQFEGEKAIIEVESDDNCRYHEVPLSSSQYFEKEQFLMLLRALPLSENFSTSLEVVIAESASKVTVHVAVVGTEKIRTELGKIDTYRVKLENLDQRAWIEIEPPHRLIKFQNDQIDTKSLLIEYNPGS